MGDAECTEGSVWEAALFASKHKLSNLVAIIDRNHIGSLDFTKNFTKLEPFTDKWKSFGWEVININGHNFDELLSTFNYVKVRSSTQPILIGAETIKGKDVSFMENDPIWHVKQLTDKDEILAQFETVEAKLTLKDLLDKKKLSGLFNVVIMRNVISHTPKPLQMNIYKYYINLIFTQIYLYICN